MNGGRGLARRQTMVSNLTWKVIKMIGPWTWMVARYLLRVAQKARAEADALDADESELTPNPNATAAHLSPGKSALIIGSVMLALAAAGALTYAFGQVMPG